MNTVQSERRIGFLSVIAGLLLGFPTAVLATTIRVETLGMTGLMQDEEDDLNFNPARLATVEGDRLFLNLRAGYNRADQTSDTSSGRSRFNFFEPAAEYLNVGNSFRWGIKYSPRFSRWTSSFDPGGFYAANTSNSTLDSRLTVGFPVGETTALGFNISASGFDSQADSSISNTSSREQVVSAELGLLQGQSDTGHWGVVVFGSMGNGTEHSTGSDETELTKFGIRILPERRLSPSTVFRGFAEVFREETTLDPNEISASSPESGETLQLSLGAGWVVEPKKGRVWTMRISGYFRDSETTTETVPSTKEEDVLSFASVGVGYEHVMVQGRLLLRVSVAPLRLTYDRNSDETTPSTEKDWTFAISGLHPIVGLGWKISPRWVADFNIADSFVTYGDSYTHTPSDRTSTTETNLVVRGALTFSF